MARRCFHGQARTRRPSMSRDFMTAVFAIYDGMTQLDFTGPHEVLARVPGLEVDHGLGRGRGGALGERARLRRDRAAGRHRALRPALRPRRAGADRGDARHRLPGRAEAAGRGRALGDLGLLGIAAAGRRRPDPRQARRLPLGLARPAARLRRRAGRRAGRVATET